VPSGSLIWTISIQSQVARMTELDGAEVQRELIVGVRGV